MHSSGLRGTDFDLAFQGRSVAHAEFFRDWRSTDRVGLLTPDPTEGLGAATLVLACVTAFYDRYRERKEEFFAYPDYFTFQRAKPTANYGMFDIWPPRKNVLVPADPQATLEAITERGITLLLVPDGPPGEPELAPVELESGRRTLRRCFAYAATGQAAAPDLIVTCRALCLREYGTAVLDTVPPSELGAELRTRWYSEFSAGSLTQSFRSLELGDALRRL